MPEEYYYFRGIRWGASELADFLGCTTKGIPAVLKSLQAPEGPPRKLPTPEEAQRYTATHRLPADPKAAEPKEPAGPRKLAVIMTPVSGDPMRFDSVTKCAKAFGVSTTAVHQAAKAGSWPSRGIKKVERSL